MQPEKCIVDRIIELETHYNNPQDGWEGSVEDYAELDALRWVLDRGLTPAEEARIEAGQSALADE